MIQSSAATIGRARGHLLAPGAAPAHLQDPAVRRQNIALSIYDDVAAVEAEWRRFEQTADCTVFQSFDWLSTWLRHIGRREKARPLIVVGRRADGDPLFLIPLALMPGVVRRLTFLGSALCDYNAPLLAPQFPSEVSAARFRELWADIGALIRSDPQRRYDLVELTKMPQSVGGQDNPFVGLDVRLHPSGAHLAQLHGSWDEFYQGKRSSATRRRDRSKRRRLGEYGEVSFVTPREAGEIARTLDTLIEQKSRAFAQMGVANVFARPGHRDFFFDLATHPRARGLVHVSRLDVGSVQAAVNLGLMFRGTYYHVLASYHDGEIARFGPGAAHLRDLLSFAIDNGCRSFDFTIGDEGYKLEWSDRLVALYDHIAPATPRGWPVALWARSRRQLKRTIKQTPALWAAFSRLRSLLRRGRTQAHGEAARQSE
jgi:CelD/BcsL family acetyltransferase involved in cellulose biosynthesis